MGTVVPQLARRSPRFGKKSYRNGKELEALVPGRKLWQPWPPTLIVSVFDQIMYAS